MYTGMLQKIPDSKQPPFWKWHISMSMEPQIVRFWWNLECRCLSWFREWSSDLF